ncbi:MAG: S8 family serine peptidase [Thermodesulfovibrionia bacterium]|nr:S8 family serine peptidase [Thermodesulfovibrionia bacterium]
MKKSALSLVALIILAITNLAYNNVFASEPEYVPGEVLVKFRDIADVRSMQNVHSVLKATPKGEFSRLKIHHMKLPAGMSVEDAVMKYKEDPNVEYAEPNYIVHTLAVTPNDTSFTQLWGLNNTGQSGGTSDADIDAPEAWDLTKGSESVIIAVVDTGVAYNHTDFSNNIWINNAEVANGNCTNGIDDNLNGFIDDCGECGDGIDNDSNGYTDDCRGWDFVEHDGSPFDLNEHGTHVAGTIAAQGNNALGVTGVMWNAKIMPLRFLGLSGSGTTSDAILAIQYAVDNGARIINNSWGGGGFSHSLEDTIEIYGSDVLFVFAAGNTSRSNDTSPTYPASYDSNNIIAVAATDNQDKLASFSSYGPTTVDLGAPGVSIYSTIPQYSYGAPVTVYDSLGFEGTTGALPLQGWSRFGTNFTWAVTAGTGAGVSNSLEDSPPGANYQNDTLSTAGYMTPITSANGKRYTLKFDWKGELEHGWDFLDIKYTDTDVNNDGIDDGICDNAAWDWIDYRTGDTNGLFVLNDQADLTPVAETYDKFCFGFGMDTDIDTVYDGVYIDNVRLEMSDITISGYSYYNYSGTSMATPHVSGVAGLILAVNPNLTNLQVKDIILNNVDTAASLTGKVLTGGRLNAFNAVQAAEATVDTGGGGGGGEGGGGGCFIATAAYGSYLAPEVEILKHFRDRHLLTNTLGRSFVKLYYRYSPALADTIRENEGLKFITRAFLLPVILIVKHPLASSIFFISILLLITILLPKTKRESIS